jgi:phenylalanyl-tRNA synthetase beta chain
LESEARAGKEYRAVSRYPASSRDLAVVVPESVPYQCVHEAIVKGAGDLLESASLFDYYQGQPLPAGQKSLAFNIIFRSRERTLRDEEVDERMGQIREHLVKNLAASFR